MRDFFIDRRLHHAGARRRRRDEHHADRREGAHAGDRRAQGARRHDARRPAAVLPRRLLHHADQRRRLGMAIALGLCAAINLLPMPTALRGDDPVARGGRDDGLVARRSSASLTALYPGAARRGAAAGRSAALRDVSDAALHVHCRRSSSAAPRSPARAARGLRGGHAPARDRPRSDATGSSRNRFRAGLSMLGISWGIVSVVMLLAYGNGFRDALAAGSRTPSAAASSSSWPGQTSMQAGGERAGRRVRVTVEDALSCRELPLVKSASPELVEERCRVVRHRSSRRYLIRAVAPEYGADAHRDPAPGRPVPGRRRRAAASPRRLHRLRGEPEAVRRERRRSASRSASAASRSK